MSKRILFVLGLGMLLGSSFLHSATPVADEVLKAADHENLGKKIAGFVAAKQDNKDIDKAQKALSDDLETIRKRIKRDPLSLTSDLGKALWQSFAYDRQQGIRKGKVAPLEVVAPNEEERSKLKIEYALWAPAKYDPKKAYPLILGIPDKGIRPTDHLTEKWTSEALRDNAIMAVCPMPEDTAQWTESGSQGKPGGIGNLLTVFREVRRMYAIDFDRVYLAGWGEGVSAAVTIASRFPDRFAGVIGRSGDPGEVVVENFRNLPTFFAGAGSGATAMSDKIEKSGYNNCTQKPEGTEADIWAWIQDHPRISNPSEVVLVPGKPFPNKAYWLEVPPIDVEGKTIVKATIDKPKNTVIIDGEGVTSVVLYFNDLLVDLDKPVKVVCNTIEHLDVIPRSLGTTLGLIYNARNDPGKLYTAQKTYDLPAKPKPK